MGNENSTGEKTTKDATKTDGSTTNSNATTTTPETTNQSGSTVPNPPSNAQDAPSVDTTGINEDGENMIAKEGVIGVRANLIRHKVVENFDEFFETIKPIGGNENPIDEVKNKISGHLYAAKKLKKSNLLRKELDKLRNELDLFREMDNPNIVKLFEVYEDNTNFYLIMEKCEGGDIFDRLASQSSAKFTEKHAADLIMAILRAVNYIHSKDVCHGSLCLENFLFNTKDIDSPIKLVNFGLSQRYSNIQITLNSISSSSPYYIAPELLKSEPFSYASDMWSIGVMTYILLTGTPPFNASSDREIKQKILRGMYDVGPAKFGKVSKDAKDFIQSLLKMDPKTRLTASNAMKHKWILRTKDDNDMFITDDVVNGFKNFHSISTMKKTALEAIGFGLNFEEVNEFKKSFEAIDTDGNGVIDLKEMREAFKPRGYSDQDIEKLFHAIDSNNTGFISYSEFLAASIRNIKAIKKESLLEAFHRLDASGNGYLDVEDFKVLLGQEFNQEEIEDLVRKADTSGDGLIDFDEFVALMSEHLDIKLQE